VKAFIDSEPTSSTSESAAAIERTFALAGVAIPRHKTARVKLTSGRPTFDFHRQKRGLIRSSSCAHECARPLRTR
jgi:hypothetical protein